MSKSKYGMLPYSHPLYLKDRERDVLVSISNGQLLNGSMLTP